MWNTYEDSGDLTVLTIRTDSSAPWIPQHEVPCTNQQPNRRGHGTDGTAEVELEEMSLLSLTNGFHKQARNHAHAFLDYPYELRMFEPLVVSEKYSRR